MRCEQVGGRPAHHASAQGLGSVWRHVMARQACPSTSGRRSPSAASMRGASWRSSRAGTPGARRCDDAAPGLSDGRFDHIRPANSAARRATGVAFQLENGAIRCLDVESRLPSLSTQTTAVGHMCAPASMSGRAERLHSTFVCSRETGDDNWLLNSVEDACMSWRCSRSYY